VSRPERPSERKGHADDLSQPASGPKLSVHYDPETFGRFSESIARTLGTAKFLVIQTVVVILWITVNVLAVNFRWDPYPFILLNLAFSTQAAYAAPLILLAQNRQDDRDRAQTTEDRRVAARTQADTEFLAREIASLRLMVADVATGSDLRDAVDSLREALEEAAGSHPGGADR
jgi:uncharacterized membrane protein